MARISLWLPPFSPDYSGAAAVLFDLKTVTAMHDGSGCTGNYTGYDEPRWYGSASGIFCSGLREIDAVLGDDEKLIRKMIRAAEDIRPDILALIGSPVPMVIGADLAGIARELEERTGIVSMGFNTTGTAYYDKGAYMAAAELLRRFAPAGERRPGRVNILGALPMDFYKGRETALLKAFLEDAGYEVGLTLAMDYTLEQLRRAGTAQVNVAVSRFGLLTARYMEREYGIPYLCGFPAGEQAQQGWLAALERTAREQVSRIWEDADSAGSARAEAGASILIVGEQGTAASMRTGFRGEMGFSRVAVGCLYGAEKCLMESGDVNLPTERDIKAAVNSGAYDLVIADPFLKCLLERENVGFLPFAQYAVSSKLGTGAQASVFGVNFNRWFQSKKEELGI